MSRANANFHQAHREESEALTSGIKVRGKAGETASGFSLALTLRV